jgi:dTDP-4-dehydrorhamnose reductase
MRLLITGGSGYLGTGLLRCVPPQWQVAATYRQHPIAGPGVTAIKLDVRDPVAVQHAVADFHPDVIIHAAAVMSGNALLTTNAAGSRFIAHAAARVRARLIHLSSDVIFDGEHAPYNEDAPPAPISPYGASKAEAERAVREECPSAVIVRTSLIYGFSPLDPRTQQTMNGEMPNLFTDEYRCPIFVDDLAAALLELIAVDYAGVLNIAGPQRLSRYDFGIKLVQSLHAPVKFAPALCASSPSPRPRDCTLDIARARSLLRTPLRSVDQGLADMPTGIQRDDAQPSTQN